jgi:hypothetical protein
MAKRADGASYNAIVTKDYAAEFADPITLTRGETATLDGRKSVWEDNPDWLWVWGTNAQDKGGWTPCTRLRIEGSSGVALEDYDARELTVTAGEWVVVQREESGWAWCVVDPNRAGWVPLSHLRRAS